MIISSDHFADDIDEDSNAAKLLALCQEVFHEWEQGVRAAIPKSQTLARPILIDTLPAFYGDLMEAVAHNSPRELAGVTSTVAMEHGGERARLTEYEPQEVIREWQILKEAIHSICGRSGITPLPHEQRTIDESFDGAIRDSITAFTLVQAGLRERFIASLAHDFRTPLSAAQSAVDLASRVTEPERVQKLLTIAHQNHLRLGEMVNDLLDVMLFTNGRKPDLHLTEWDLVDIVKVVRDEFTELHNVTILISGVSVVGYWDKQALRRALENLVENAVKYGDRTQPICIKIKPYNERVMLSVHNDGEPIAPEENETIFQVFNRAAAAKRNETAGWGIGLSYVRSVAESHGGSIAVDSAKERGTTFSIDIPVDSRLYSGSPTL